MRKALNIEVSVIPGKSGQYDVVVDGEVVASRSSNLLKRLTGGGWPGEDEVVEILRKRIDSAAPAR